MLHFAKFKFIVRQFIFTVKLIYLSKFNMLHLAKLKFIVRQFTVKLI